VTRTCRLASQIRQAALAKWQWTVVLVVLIASVVTFGYYANPSAGDSGSKVAGAAPSSAGARHRPVDDSSRSSRAELPDTTKPGSVHPKEHADAATPRLTPGGLIAYHLLRGSDPSATPAVKTDGAPSATPDRGPSVATVRPPATTETTLGPPPTTTTTTTTTRPPPPTTPTTRPPPTTTTTTTPPTTTTTTVTIGIPPGL
jgi:hypothetical protein